MDLADDTGAVARRVLMHQHQFTRQEAFDVLRVASQNSNRKLADIAIEVVDTGTLSIRGWPAGELSDPHPSGVGVPSS